MLFFQWGCNPPLLLPSSSSPTRFPELSLIVGSKHLHLCWSVALPGESIMSADTKPNTVAVVKGRSVVNRNQVWQFLGRSGQQLTNTTWSPWYQVLALSLGTSESCACLGSCLTPRMTLASPTSTLLKANHLKGSYTVTVNLHS